MDERERSEFFLNWLRAEVDAKGWDQTRLAAELGIGQGTVSRWMGEDVQYHTLPPPKYCRMIAEALGLDESVVLAVAGHGGPVYSVKRLVVAGELRRMVNVLDTWRSDTLKRIEEVERVEHGVSVDGDDTVVAVISPMDEVEVFGFYVTFKPVVPR